MIKHQSPAVFIFLTFEGWDNHWVDPVSRCQSHTSCVTSDLTVGQWWGHDQQSQALKRSVCCVFCVNQDFKFNSMKSDHNGSANLPECCLLLATPSSIPKLLPDPLLTKHHPRCLHLECDWVGRLNFGLQDFKFFFIIRIFLMILLRIKGYNRHLLSPGTQRHQEMEFHKRINKPLLR